MQIGEFDFPDSCPSHCPRIDIGCTDQGDICSRCPIFNCTGDDPLIQPEEYNIDFAREYYYWFKLNEEDD